MACTSEPGEGWRGERRVRLLDAASRVFARQAYEHASMDEIAHEAGVGKPTLYRYFPSKEELFAAVFGQALDALEEKLAAVLEAEHGIAQRLRGLVAATVPTVRQHLVSLRLLGQDAAAADQSKRRVFRERRERIAGFMARALDEGVRAGEVRPLDSGRVAHLTIGMIWSGSSWAATASADELATEIADLVLHGICNASSTNDARREPVRRNGSLHPSEPAALARRPREAALR